MIEMLSSIAESHPCSDLCQVCAGTTKACYCKRLSTALSTDRFGEECWLRARRPSFFSCLTNLSTVQSYMLSTPPERRSLVVSTHDGKYYLRVRVEVVTRQLCVIEGSLERFHVGEAPKDKETSIANLQLVEGRGLLDRSRDTETHRKAFPSHLPSSGAEQNHPELQRRYPTITS